MNKNLREQKGITLIALIITIVVMLILVGVSVNIALGNGLFNTASDVARRTEEAAKAENLLAEGKIDGMNIVDYANSFGGGSEETPTVISLSENPTHILKFHGKTYEIDATTTTVAFTDTFADGEWKDDSYPSYHGKYFYKDMSMALEGNIPGLTQFDLTIAGGPIKNLMECNGYFCLVETGSEEIYAKFEISAI